MSAVKKKSGPQGRWMAQAARELSVSLPHLWMVVNGVRQSKRLLAQLEAWKERNQVTEASPEIRQAGSLNSNTGFAKFTLALAAYDAGKSARESATAEVRPPLTPRIPTHLDIIRGAAARAQTPQPLTDEEKDSLGEAILTKLRTLNPRTQP